MPARLGRTVWWLLTGFAVAFAFTCVEVPDNAVFACEEGGCPAPLVCKAGFCVNEDCQPLTCVGLGKNCGTISDGCGNDLDCGSCQSPESCNANLCSCEPTPAPAMCADAGFVCGALSATDACGQDREVECGACGAGAVCTEGACCTPKTQAELCTDRDLFCGDQTVIDNCGQRRELDCGGCDAGTACISFDTSSSCEACVSETDSEFCYRNGLQCGAAPTLTDNCGIQRAGVDCGAFTCEDGRTCGADGGTRCACATELMTCSSSAQCCGGLACGKAGLCCYAPGSSCTDDSTCCNGTCTAGKCAPGPDGGSS